MKRLKFAVETKEAPAPTRLAIGVEGGFQDTKKFNYEEHEQIVVLPEGAVFNLDDPKLPEQVRRSADGVNKAESAFKTEELNATAGTWDGEVRQVIFRIHTDSVKITNMIIIMIILVIYSYHYCDEQVLSRYVYHHLLGEQTLGNIGTTPERSAHSSQWLEMFPL